MHRRLLPKNHNPFIMRNFLGGVIALIGVAILLSGCARYYTERGDAQTERFGYAKAARYYEKAYKKKPSQELALKLANSYRNMNEYAKADKYFAEGIKDGAVKQDPMNHLSYGKILMNMGKYGDAKSQFTTYLSDKPGDYAAQLLLNSCGDLAQFTKDTMRYSLQDAGISGFNSAYSPIIYKEGLVFVGETSARGSKANPGTMNSFQDLFFAKKEKDGRFGKAEKLKGALNDKYHQGSATFNREGNIIYYTTSNTSGLKPSERYEKVINSMIGRDSLAGDEWKASGSFPYNNSDYSTQHPSLGEDGKTLFFASDMPGGLGGYDLYVTRYESGRWTKPENLGAPINTAMDERFPVAAKGGKLYFASNGHKNLGGLDVFLSRSAGGKWSNPMNLHYPLNTKADDFGFVIAEDGKTGYISSNRKGSDQIYSVVINPPVMNAKGRVTSNGAPLQNATIILTNNSGNTVDSVFTDSDGNYTYKLTLESDYQLMARKTDYLNKSATFSTKNAETNADIMNDFELAAIEKVIEKPIVLDAKDVLYDYNKWKLRKPGKAELDKVVALLKDNPTLKIEMGSHTDSRGTDKYNQRLSEKRAKTCSDYLIKAGIDQSRVSSVGYGETQLVNECKDGVKCSDAKHQENRRTTIKLSK